MRDDRLLYIAETGRSVSERIERDRIAGVEIEAQELASDVAWLARQFSKLAELLLSEAERIEAQG